MLLVVSLWSLLSERKKLEAMLKCPKCGGIFNYYKGVSPRKGTLSEYYVKSNLET